MTGGPAGRPSSTGAPGGAGALPASSAGLGERQDAIGHTLTPGGEVVGPGRLLPWQHPC